MSNNKLIPELRFPEFDGLAIWEEKTLESIAEVNPKSSELPDEFVYVDLESVENGTLQKIKTIEKKIAPSRAQRLLKDEDVIFQMVRPYQKNNYYFKKNDDIDYVASTGYAQLRAIESSLYLYHFLHTDNFISKVLEKCTGSNYPAINSSDLSSILVQIPNPQEQQKIASCLSTLDEAITAHSQKLELLKEHKKGLMQNLFPQEGENVPKLRFKEFEKDGEWVEKKLGEICENIMYGMNAAAKVFDGENMYLRITDIDENTRMISRTSLTSPNGVLEDRYLLNAGDLVFARTGASVGKSYLHQNNTGKFYFAGFLIRFSIAENVPYFIYSQTLTEQYQKWVLKTSMRSGQPGINAEEYKSYTLFIPPNIKEQQKIASCLSSLDALIAAQAEKIEQLKLHKKGLMQGLFPKNMG